MIGNFHRHRRRSGVGVAALAALALFGAACSSSDDEGTTTAATSDGAEVTTTTGTEAPSDTTVDTTVDTTTDDTTADTATDVTVGTVGTVEVEEGVPLSADDANAVAQQLLGPIEIAEGDTTRGIDDKVIRIGGVATVKDAAGTESYPGVCDGAKARFERANSEGGVNGYTFEYVGCTDDGANPDTNRQQTQDMIEQEEVFALIPYTSNVSNQGDFLNENHVPYFGWGLSPDYCGWTDRQFGFAITGAIACMPEGLDGRAFFSSVGIETYLNGTGKAPADVKAAFVGNSDYVNSVSIDSFNTIATSLGVDVVYAKTPIPGAGQPPLTDYAPVAQEIVASGADLVSVPLGPGVIISLVPALRAAGYTGDVVMYFADSRLLAVAGPLDGVYAQGPNFGSISFPSDTFEQIRADLDAVGSTAPEDGSGTLTSYASADMLINVIAGLDGDLTTESLAAAINTGYTNEQLGNVMCGTVWPAAHVVAGSCSALVQFQEKPTAALLPIEDLGPVGDVYLIPVKAG